MTPSLSGSTSANHLNVIDLQKTTLCIRTSSITLSPKEKQNSLIESNYGNTGFGICFLKSL